MASGALSMLSALSALAVTSPPAAGAADFLQAGTATRTTPMEKAAMRGRSSETIRMRNLLGLKLLTEAAGPPHRSLVNTDESLAKDLLACLCKSPRDGVNQGKIRPEWFPVVVSGGTRPACSRHFRG